MTLAGDDGVLGPVLFLGLGVGGLIVLARRGVRIPIYIHALAGVGALIGFWITTLDGGAWADHLGQALFTVIVVPALVYAAYGFYAPKPPSAT